LAPSIVYHSLGSRVVFFQKQETSSVVFVIRFSQYQLDRSFGFLGRVNDHGLGDLFRVLRKGWVSVIDIFSAGRIGVLKLRKGALRMCPRVHEYNWKA
jgi:hypothetical protein